MEIFEFKINAFGQGMRWLAHKQLRSSWVSSSVNLPPPLRAAPASSQQEL
jgi:hypothetical protein